MKEQSSLNLNDTFNQQHSTTTIPIQSNRLDLNDKIDKSPNNINKLSSLNINNQSKPKRKISQQPQRKTNDLQVVQEKLMDLSQINLLLFGGWIISLTLAKKDNSQCLDQHFDGVSFTFRQWLWINFAFSIAYPACMICVAVYYLIVKKIKNQCLICLFGCCCGCCCLCITSLASSGKLIWTIVGVIIFVYHVNFDKCSDSVILYCGAQFLVIISFLIFSVFKSVIILRKQLCSAGSCSFFSLLQSLQTMISGKDSFLQKQLKQSQQRIIESIKQIKKQLVYWAMIGWIYAFALAKKDHSQCLDQVHQDLHLSFRQWFWGDGATTLITFFIFVILFCLMRKEQDQNRINKQIGVIQLMISNSDWIKKTSNSGSFIYCVIFVQDSMVNIGIGDVYRLFEQFNMQRFICGLFNILFYLVQLYFYVFNISWVINSNEQG